MAYICLDEYLNENASHPNLHSENYTEVIMVYLCIWILIGTIKTTIIELFTMWQPIRLFLIWKPSGNTLFN